MTDMFTYGMEPLGILLFYGDLATARMGLAKAVDAHRRIRTLVQQDVASVEGCARPGPLTTHHSPTTHPPPTAALH